MHCLLTISSLQHNEPVTTFYIRLDVDSSSKPILVGMASLVAEISLVLLAFNMVKFLFLTMDYCSLAQKIHACRISCEMHANQFWWACPLRFHRFCSFSSLAKLLFYVLFSFYFSYDNYDINLTSFGIGTTSA